MRMRKVLPGTAVALLLAALALAEDAGPKATGSPIPSGMPDSAVRAQRDEGGDTGARFGEGAAAADAMVLEDVKRREEAVAKRAAEIDAREKELAAKEKALDEEIGSLKALRDEISGLEEARKKISKEKVGKIVETLSAMSPKSAAKMIEELDDALAVATAEQMDSQRLGKVLAAMDVKRSAKITELLAGVVRVRKNTRASNDASETTTDGKEVKIK